MIQGLKKTSATMLSIKPPTIGPPHIANVLQCKAFYFQCGTLLLCQYSTMCLGSRHCVSKCVESGGGEWVGYAQARKRWLFYLAIKALVGTCMRHFFLFRKWT